MTIASTTGCSKSSAWDEAPAQPKTNTGAATTLGATGYQPTHGTTYYTATAKAARNPKVKTLSSHYYGSEPRTTHPTAPYRTSNLSLEMKKIQMMSAGKRKPTEQGRRSATTVTYGKWR